jgi:enoyl-[acyl-carrier protein] reductase II
LALQGNEICEMLGIKYPIIQGGMAWVSHAELAAAVSNAGGLGVLAAGGLTPEELRRAIRRTRELTDQPFGVNIVLWQVLMAGQMEVVSEEGVKIIMTGVGNPRAVLDVAKSNGMLVISVVGAVRQARRAQEAGVDAIVAEGMEGGGHVGQISTLCLVPQVVEAVDVPVLAAGGIGDGRGYAAARALGASGIMMGTRFIASVECPIHPLYKQRVLEAASEDAVVIGHVTGSPSRCLQNAYTTERLDRERDGTSIDEIRTMGIGRLRRAAMDGDVEHGWMPAGQVSGMIDRLQTCQEIV